MLGQPGQFFFKISTSWVRPRKHKLSYLDYPFSDKVSLLDYDMLEQVLVPGVFFFKDKYTAGLSHGSINSHIYIILFQIRFHCCISSHDGLFHVRIIYDCWFMLHVH
jgi:hypothetical protein